MAHAWKISALSGFCALLTGACQALAAVPEPSKSQASTPSSVPTNAPGFAETAINWTPVTIKTSVVPQLFQGSDGQYNLVYELVLNNWSGRPATINDVDIVDADTGKLVKRLSGKDLAAVTTLVVPSGAVTRLAPGTAGVVFVNLVFDKAEDAPKNLSHQITFDTRSMFNGKPATYNYSGAKTEVNSRKPVVIGPPLKGGRWLAIGGYCGVAGHRRAFFSIDNKLAGAQRYAIDWVRLDDDNYTVKGDPYKTKSSPSYGVPIYAVADGTIVEAVDAFPDQIPYKPTGDNRFTHPAGNCIVLDIGGGLYGMYAHLEPGSLKVKKGDNVKRGDVIASLGNTGNSTGPHLHFHIVDGAPILSSNGVPYVFDQFKLVGQLANLQQLLKADPKATPLTIAEVKDPGMHQQQLPRESHIVEF